MLPLWFLVLALVLPRISIAALWIQNQLPVVQGVWPWLLIGAWVIAARFLVAFYIYYTMGPNLWFWVHLLAAFVVATGTAIKARR